MFNLFKNNKEYQESGDQSYSKIAALLIHAAKIDGSYTKDEEKIIKKTLVELGAKLSNIDLIIANAINFEENSNQILDFTREIKNAAESDKIKIIESLWKIIYSNNIGDMYETNLMRRLAGLLYIDAKIMGDIKEKIKKELKK
ncbi:TerB family tellurite resistance protein [Candidatus Pelagibacter sp.]|nr:TerB family tellurite resistance protein [Candidatus Pelagibacter sp.]|tara:strand:- start:58 stop:486 length:429 start_codon:yes stop_codon:yes gene_type:complete